MMKIREAIVVEGQYDIGRLRSVVDTLILQTHGFRIFRDDSQLALLRRIADERGLIILTDSDGAGLVIRNYLRGALPQDRVRHAYIPEIHGKERRKRHPSKEGTLGVEGMDRQVLLQALERAGATFCDTQARPSPATPPITKSDLYELGLSGGAQSAVRRKMLLSALSLPGYLSAGAMLEVVNSILDRDTFFEMVRALPPHNSQIDIHTDKKGENL